MAKDINSNWLGNSVDGDVEAWPETIRNVMDRFDEAEIVVPGHGDFGGKELLPHTLNVLRGAQSRSDS